MKYSDIKISERVKRKTPNEWRTMSNVDKICYALCMSSNALAPTQSSAFNKPSN